MVQSTITKSRGKFLTIMLVLAAFGVLSSAYTLVNSNSIAQTYGTVPSWFYPYLIFGFTLGVVNIVGLWLWKKWAVYTFFAASVISIIMPLFVLKPLDPNVGMVSFYMTIISCGLWFWAVYRKWNLFD